MGLVDHEHDLYFGVDVQESLHEEGVRDFVLLALVVLESGTVIEGQVFNDDFVGDGGFGVLLVSDFDGVAVGAVEDWLEPVVADEEFSPG